MEQDKKMRILFVLANYFPHVGGAETLFKRLTEGLVRNGHQVRVITSMLPNTPRAEDLNGVEIERIRVPVRKRQMLFSFSALPRVAKLARKFDVMHTSSNYSAAVAFMAAKIARKPVVLTCCEVLGTRWHKLVDSKPKAALLRYVERTAVRLPYDRHVCISHATQRDLANEGVKAESMRIAYCGVDERFYDTKVKASSLLREQLGIASDDFVYMYYGRPGITKGVPYLIQASEAIQAQIPNAHLVLILGSEPADIRSSLIDQADALPASVNVHILPSVDSRDDLVSYLRDSDCIVVPSLTEGFGLTTAEASAANVPIVASRVGSIPEVISGRHILVEPASPEAIADGVIRVWRGSYDFVEPKQFAWSTMTHAYEAIYRDLLSPVHGEERIPAQHDDGGRYFERT